MANTILQVIIAEANTEKVLKAFTGMAMTPMELYAMKSNGYTSWKFSYPAQSALETDKQFAVRVILELIRAFMRLQSLIEDKTRFDLVVATIPPPAQTIPDNIVTGS